jgi:D-alanyl-D-alanine carboxypeptidase
MKNTHFKNPAGLDDFGQYTSPFDLSLASRRLLENPILTHIVSIKNITVSDTDFKYFHPLSNVNKLLGEITGVGGLKTGYTLDAGENLITFYKYNSHQYLIIVLNSEDRFEDTKSIVNWIDNNINYISL